MAESSGTKCLMYLHMMKSLSIPILISCLFLFSSCSAQKKISHSELNSLIGDTALKTAHIGISVYDPSAGKYLYDYQGDKYFVPASNTKIITCYAALKYLKHILPGIKYYQNDTAIFLVPTGDPSLLHRDFMHQPVISFLQQQQKHIYITDLNWKDKELGNGWSWDDFSDDYMTERNALPVYGNTIRWVQERIRSNNLSDEQSASVYSDPEVNWKVRFETDLSKKKFEVVRDRQENIFKVTEGPEQFKEVYVPFIVNGLQSSLELLRDTVGKEIRIANNFLATDPQPEVIWSQPADSILIPMMHRSDNFFAEQLLLMVSAEKLGIMNDEAIIDTIIKSDLADLPQPPSWVDGSGLSRYNMFSPKDFIVVLNKMQTEFGMDRMKIIFPTGGSGTLKNYYKSNKGFVYAKTGSMTGVLCISGYVYTKKNKLLLFSVLINNYNGSNSVARRKVEEFIKQVRAGN